MDASAIEATSVEEVTYTWRLAEGMHMEVRAHRVEML